MNWPEKATKGLKVFDEILPYAWYDGAISGYARSASAEIGSVWFSAVAISPKAKTIIYVLCEVPAREYDAFLSEYKGPAAPGPPHDLDEKNLGLAPQWLCISDDRLESVTAIVRLQPGTYPGRVPAEETWPDNAEEWLPFFGFPFREA